VAAVGVAVALAEQVGRVLAAQVGRVLAAQAQESVVGRALAAERVRAPQPEDLTRVLEASVREDDPPILAGRLTPLPIGPVRESRLPRDRATRRLCRGPPDKAQRQVYARGSLVRLSAPNSG
jgi:hypothetical protein